jgi:hemerythrin-like metal-binding protein
MPLQWTPDLALGIPELDGQHLQIDAHLRMLHDAVCEGRVPDVAAVIDGLRRATARHFATEERLLAAAGEPDLERHRAAHRAFTERLGELDERCRRDGAAMPLAMELGNWLAAWIREHQRHDLELRRLAPADAGVGGG